MSFETVIGLETHVQLATKSKIFSGAPVSFGAPANTQACAIDLGFPGVLPVLNEQVVQMAILFGLAVNAEIAPYSVFERKNYFYPDLPKGYQISQQEFPIVIGGTIPVAIKSGSIKQVRLTRAHLEEDAGKSIHQEGDLGTGVDLNRAGTPLLEIVTEPDLSSADEAVHYLKTLHTLVQYLEICDGDMAQGSLRCDVNISLKPIAQQALGTRVEIKNMNSFRFIEKAIHYEVKRQTMLLAAGKPITQETRLYDAEKNETRAMRSKEEMHDYRYFADPDLPPVRVSEAQVAKSKQQLPELPWQKQQRFMDQYGLEQAEVVILTDNRLLADFFEQAVGFSGGLSKPTANWIVVELLGVLNKNNVLLADSPISAQAIGQLVAKIADNTISGKMAKQVFADLWEGTSSVAEIIKAKGLKKVSNEDTIRDWVQSVIDENHDQVTKYKQSDANKQKKMVGFFVGKVMQLSKGQADPKQVNDWLNKLL